jgi:predicted transcriptional regulator
MADEIRLVPSPEEIRHHRIELGISQYDMAIQTNLSQSMISRIESGNVNPTISTLNKILMVLHQTECEYHTPVSHIPEEEVSVR